METIKQPFLGEDPEQLGFRRLSLARTQEAIRYNQKLQDLKENEPYEQMKKEIISRMYKAHQDIIEGKTTEWKVDLRHADWNKYLSDQCLDILRQEAALHKSDHFEIFITKDYDYAYLRIISKDELEWNQCKNNLIYIFFSLLCIALAVVFIFILHFLQRMCKSQGK
jgi:hypothetical protein